MSNKLNETMPVSNKRPTNQNSLRPIKRIENRDDKYKRVTRNIWTKIQNFFRINQKYLVFCDFIEEDFSSSRLLSTYFSKKDAITEAKRREASRTCNSVSVYCEPAEKTVWSWYSQ